MRSNYDTGEGHKLTQIETLNCGQSDAGMLSSASQYVDGPVGYLESKLMTDEPNLIEPNTTPRRNKAIQQQESFYSTPCVPGIHVPAIGKQNPSYMLNGQEGSKIGSYITATLRKTQGPGAGVGCNAINTAMLEQMRSDGIYGDLLNRAQTSGAHQFASNNNSHHPYYTHSLIAPSAMASNSGQPNGGCNNSSNKNPDHVYELPKQQQIAASLLQQFVDSKDNAASMTLMMQPQADSSRSKQQQTQQSPLRSSNTRQVVQMKTIF